MTNFKMNRVNANRVEVTVTKAFEKKANYFGTPEYEQWCKIVAREPYAVMVTKTIKKNSKKKSFLNLTYDNMRGYIATQNNAKDLLEEFDKQLALSKIQTSPYRFVVAWFEQKFENYDSYKKYFEELKKKAEAESETSNAA